jgi:hypothetical protein
MPPSESEITAEATRKDDQMSRTRRAKRTGELDNFPTPGWCVRRLLDIWQPPVGVLVEPACGDGAIIREIRGAQWHWISYDVREVQTVAEMHRQCDFLTVATPGPTVKAVITNPPYCLAEEFIRKSRALYPNAELVFLLRLAFLASHERLPLWRDIGVPDIMVLPNRPSFGLNKKGKRGTDSTDYAWFRWPARGPQVTAFGCVRVLADTPKSERIAADPRRKDRNA